MSQTPPPPDDVARHDALISDAAQLSHWFIHRIRLALTAWAGKLPVLGYLRALLRQYILPAESILRREIHLIAGTLPPLGVRPQTAGARLPSARASQANRRAMSDPSKPRAPLFRLTEAQPRPRADDLPVHQRPRISVAGLAPFTPAKAAPPDNLAESLYAGLRRRFAALEAAWNDPSAAARRLQRLRARKPAGGPTLCFDKIPGSGAKILGGPAGHLLRDLNTTVFEDEARRALRPHADTS